MKKNQAVLLKLLAKQLFGRKVSIPELTPEEWEEVFAESKYQAVSRIAFLAANDCNIPTDVYQKWLNFSYSVLRNSAVVENGHVVLNDWMIENNIPYVVLKGCSSAYYYPESIDRAMGDVDFLIRRSDLNRAGEIFKSKGLKPWEIDHICHVVYRNGNQHYEMHFDIPGVPKGPKGDLVHQYISDIFEKSTVVDVGNGQMCLPSKFHHGLVILLHTSHHLTGEGVGLRHLCDWAVFLESCSDEEFENLFKDKLTAIGMWKFARVLSAICVRYLGCSRKRFIGKADKSLVDGIMEDIITGGNFGKKDSSDRSLQSRLISDRGKSGIKNRSMLSYFISSVNESVRNHWRITQKIHILIPFGWIYFGTLKLIRAFKRKVMPNAFTVINGASKRRDLYSQLGLFGVEE